MLNKCFKHLAGGGMPLINLDVNVTQKSALDGNPWHILHPVHHRGPHVETSQPS